VNNLLRVLGSTDLVDNKKEITNYRKDFLKRKINTVPSNLIN